MFMHTTICEKLRLSEPENELSILPPSESLSVWTLEFRVASQSFSSSAQWASGVRDIISLAGLHSRFEMETPNAGTLPHLPVNIRRNAGAIAIQFASIIFTTSILCIIIYFILKYPANTSAAVYLGVATVPFAVGSLFQWFVRLCRLTSRKKAENFLPLGATSRWQLDFFQWEFTAGILLETLVITISVSLKPTTETPFRDGVIPRLTTFALPLLVANLSIQILLANILVVAGLRNPCTISSVQKGEPLRPALYSIIEDVVAVDAKQGRHYRELWDQRYRSSPNGMMRKLLLDMGWIWGISGICYSALIGGIILPRSVMGYDAAFTLGFASPWVWAGLMALFTSWFVTRRLQMEWAAANEQGSMGQA